MVQFLIYSFVIFSTISLTTQSDSKNDYQEKALSKINEIRRRYFRDDLELSDQLQNSSQEYVKSLAQNDIGLRTTPEKYLLECGRLIDNGSLNETSNFMCGEILSMELNLSEKSIQSCNLEAIIGMWEGEEYFFNGEKRRNDSFYKENIKSFSKIIWY
jgi:hypothetical protein